MTKKIYGQNQSIMTSSMNKQLLITALIAFCLSAAAQDVRYYKLSSTRIGGTTNKNVSGGQFITFVSDLCFESTSKGVGVGHGTLTRNKNYSNAQYTTYQGSSYWGSSTTFKFNADRSVLNVVLDNGDIYVYKRATPPAGATTCSLIRKPSSSSSGGTYIPQPTYPVQQYPQQQYPQQQQSQPQPTPTPTPAQKKREGCTWCNGTGIEVRDDAFQLGLDDKKYCSKCGKTVFASHYHATCRYCNGKGYKEY